MKVPIRDDLKKTVKLMTFILSKRGVGPEFYENKFLFYNCDIRGGGGRTLYDTISLPYFFHI